MCVCVCVCVCVCERERERERMSQCVSVCGVLYVDCLTVCVVPMFLIVLLDSFCYLWSVSWGVFSLQRRGQHSSAPNPAASSKYIKTQINV